MAYYPTQRDIDVLSSPEKILYAKILLLNENLQTVYEMKHEYVSGQMSTNIDSDIRNTCSLTLAVIDKNVGLEEDKLLWVNRFIKVLIGVQVPYTADTLYEYNGTKVVATKRDDNDTLWYDKGIFVVTDYSYSPQNGTLNINCSDLVCYLNGDISGSLEGLKQTIPESEKLTIRQAIIDTLTGLTKFKKYYVEDMPKLIPYDLEFTPSDSVWTILTTLRDLYPSYEMFFDTDGTFICKKVNVKESDPVVLDDSILQRLYITETDTGDRKSMRNVTKVFGKCLDTDYYTDVCTYDSKTNTYSATFTGVAINDDGSLPTSAKFAVKIPEVNATKSPKLALYNKEKDDSASKLVSTFSLVDSSEKEIAEKFFVKDSSFVFRYRRANMLVMGQWQIMAVNKLRNTEPTAEEKKKDIEKHGCDFITYTIDPNSPFAIERIGEYMKVCSDADYDKIQAIDDCITRAEYETWLAAKIAYTITLEMVYIPWLQGNEKVQFTLAATGETKDWVVTSISSSHPYGTMSLTLTEFSPLYNFDVKDDSTDSDKKDDSKTDGKT